MNKYLVAYRSMHNDRIITITVKASSTTEALQTCIDNSSLLGFYEKDLIAITDIGPMEETPNE